MRSITFIVLFIFGTQIFASNGLLKSSFWIDTTSSIPFEELVNMKTNIFIETNDPLIAGGKSENTLWIKIDTKQPIKEKNYILINNIYEGEIRRLLRK